MRKARRAAARIGATAIVVLVCLAAAPAAGAHASLASADPAPGSTLTTPPTTITLTFTETPDVDLTTVELLDAGGSTIATGPAEVAGPRTVQVPITQTLPDGAYTVSWRVVSSVDGHVTAGTVAFGVGVAPPGDATIPEPEVSGPSVLSVAAKASLYAGLMLLVAVAGVGLGAFAGRHRSLHVVAMVAALFALVGVAGMLVAEQRSVGVPMSDLLASSTGRPLLWLTIAVLIADALAVLGAAKRRWRPILWGAGAAAAAAMLVRATGGHAAAASPALPQELLQWVHMLAAGLWVGGLVLLWALLRERAPSPEGTVDPPVREARRFSRVAVVAVAVVVMTGVIRASVQLGGFGAAAELLDTSYGRVLALKVGGAIALIVLGARNRRRSLPRLATDPRPLRRLVAAECAIALGVVLLTATLTGLAPPADEDTTAAAEPPPTVTATGTDFATTTRVDLVVSPGSPGPSAIEAHVTDPDDGASIPADEVTLRLRPVSHPEVPPESVPLLAQGDTWAATTPAISLAGTWAATAVVRLGSDATEIPLVVITRLPDATTTAEVGPGLPTIWTTTFATGSSLQTYVDPAMPGPNQIHASAFSADGTEAALDDVVIVAIPAVGEPRGLEVLDFGPGHVAANVDLEAGDWTFDVVATARDGEVMQATFDTTVEAM